MKLLKQLYMIHSPSHKETAMQDFLTGWLDDHSIHYIKDEKGNILAAKGEADTYPCVCAHMDEVHDKREEDYKIHQDGDVLYGFSPKAGGQQGIGADDKNGIWVALRVLEKAPVLKAAFFVGEEVGCIGSSFVDLGFFENCRFVIQCDRKNGSDFIMQAGGVPLCTQEFMDAMKAHEYGYKKEYGLMTDVMELRRRGLKCCACNLSCGYYHPHMSSEITRMSELRNCLKMVIRACCTLTETFEAPVYEPPKTSYTGTSSWRTYGSGYGSDYDNDYGRDYNYYDYDSYNPYRNYNISVNNPTSKSTSNQTQYNEEEDTYTEMLYMFAESWAISDALETAIIKQAKPYLIKQLQNAKDSLDQMYSAAPSYKKVYDNLAYAIETGWLLESQVEDILAVIDEDWVNFEDEYTNEMYSDWLC